MADVSELKANYSPPNVNYWGDRCYKAEHEIARLRAALKPFADLAREFCVDEREPHEVVTHAVIHAGDLLAAFNALQQSK